MTDVPSGGVDGVCDACGSGAGILQEDSSSSDPLDEHDPEPDEGARRRVVRRPPEQTTDDTDAGWGERTEESAHDRWLQEQRPPHWD